MIPRALSFANLFQKGQTISAPMKILRDLRHDLFYRAIMRKNVPLLALGDESTGCQWTFCPAGLSAGSIIYSGGVGKDITFEHGLADRFGCQIWLFDPSPTGENTMRLAENIRPEFHYERVGISGKDGAIHLAPPTNPEEGSWFAAEGASAERVSVECKSLASLMKANGHDHIDLLKLDIEGPEYAVIEDILANRLSVHQICVEYHHGMLPGIRRSQTIRSLGSLLLAGYCLIYKIGNNHTFIRKCLLRELEPGV